MAKPLRRRLAGILVALTTASLLAAPSPAHAADTGLFGQSDPTYDGVFRQSLSIISLKSAGREVPAAAIRWLLEQQCPNGAFQGYRADPTAACRAFDNTSYTGIESNSTALAAIALAALGRPERAAKAVRWLRAAQNPDGGLPLARGGTSDAISTALALLAARSVNLAQAQFATGRQSLLSYLRRSMLVCNAPAASQGAFSFQLGTPLTADDMTTAQVVAALSGSLNRQVPRLKSGDLVFRCPARVTAKPGSLLRASAAYVSSRLKANEYRLPSAWGGGTDWTSTAWAVLGLIGTGRSAETVASTVSVLRANAKGVITSPYSGKVEPGRIALLLLVASARGANPEAFGGHDLPAELLATLR